MTGPIDRQLVAAKERLARMHAEGPPSLGEVLEELGMALEELEISVEELRAQNEELVEARSITEAERARYALLFNLAPCGYVVTDAAGTITEANLAMGVMTGRRPDHLAGKPIDTLLAWGDRRSFPRRLAALRRGEQLAVRGTIPRGVGEPGTPVSILAVASGEPEGTERVIRWVISDDSERARADEERRTLERHKEAVAAYVSHELRSPLAAILGLGESLHSRWEDLDDETRHRSHEAIYRSSKEMARLVDGLLDLSRIEEDEIAVGSTAIELGPAIRAWIADHRILLDPHPITVDIPDGAAVLADDQALERIFGNLVMNAAKYSARSAPIDIVATTLDGEVLVTVRDHGIGISEEERGLVFDPFYRGTNVSGIQGAGIGLTIVQRYVDALGGRVSVQGTPGGGSSFTVALAPAR